jgi:hypothetical protein
MPISAMRAEGDLRARGTDVMEERMGRLSLRFLILIGALGMVAALPATAAAQVTIDAYKITPALQGANSIPLDGPASFQAGAFVDAGSWSRFTYPNGTEDLKIARTNFAAGLLGNPESAPKCPEASLQANTCPSNTSIGTSRLDAVVAGSTTLAGSFTGTVYNAEPLANEPGRLGVVTTAGPATLISSIPFYITPRGGGDYGLTGVLSDVNRLPAAAFGTDLQVRALSFVLNGSTNSYVRNPTSCGTHISTGDASGYESTTPIEGPPYGFNTIGCESLPFAPTTTFEIGDRGSTAFNKFPPVVIKITQTTGQADQLGNKITLPVELNSNNAAYKTCTQAQADADACPANSQFGGVVAKSPYLAEELKGPVYLIQQTGTSLPGLLLDLNGRVHVKIQTKTTLINNKRIQSLVLNSPQLPVSELRVALNGGRTTGVFLNRSDLCFSGDSTSKFNSLDSLVKDYGHNGAVTTERKIKAKVNGCGPGVTGKITGATSIRPSVRVNVKKHPDSPNFKELTVTVSKNLSFVENRVNQGIETSADASVEFLSRRSVRIYGLPAAGEDEVDLSFRKGAIRVSDRSQTLLERGQSRKFSVKVKQTPVTGSATSTRGTFRAKGRK